MKLIQLLGTVNQIERTSFLRILDGFCADVRKGEAVPEVDRLLSESDGKLKNVDDINIAALFQHFSARYSDHLQERLVFGDRQLGVLVDILVRDGNAIMSREWFAHLHRQELDRLRGQVQTAALEIEAGRDPAACTPRQRDYATYFACVRTAYENDDLSNRERRISWDERSILNTLAQNLDLSHEEVRAVEHNVVAIEQPDLDGLITLLKDAGIVFYQRKSSTLFIADEVVWLLRDQMGIELATKYQRRVLRHLSDAELNRVARRHNIDRTLGRPGKLSELLASGISMVGMLLNDIHREGTSKTDRAGRIQLLLEKELEIDVPKYGRSLEQKVQTLVEYFRAQERDESASLSADGYGKLLHNLREQLPVVNDRLKEDFELQPDDVMSAELLSSYSIQPRDVLYLLTKAELKDFCTAQEISSRGNLILNVLKKYRNIEDLLLENIELIGGRDLASLREKGLSVKESELGALYEQLTRRAFQKLGLKVDEKLAAKLNTKRAKIDVLLNLGNDEVIVVECKTKKDRHYDNYSGVTRQLASYEKLCVDRGLRVRHHVVIANDFSEDFVGECEYDDELSLSLLTSRGLSRIVESYLESKRAEFPIKLLLKAGLLNEERIATVLTR